MSDDYTAVEEVLDHLLSVGWGEANAAKEALARIREGESALKLKIHEARLDREKDAMAAEVRMDELREKLNAGVSELVHVADKPAVRIVQVAVSAGQYKTQYLCVDEHGDAYFYDNKRWNRFRRITEGVEVKRDG